MLQLLIVFGAGLIVGAIYGATPVRSPAPPVLALAGLFAIWVTQLLLTTLVR